MSTFFADYPVSGGTSIPKYPTFSDFPSAVTAGNGALAIALDTDTLYISNGTIWEVIASPSTVVSIGPIDSVAPSANGAVISSNALILQSASATFPGLVNNTTQTLSGSKTFTDSVLISDKAHISYTFTTSSSVNVSAGDIYTDGTYNFTVLTTGSSVTTVVTNGSNRPATYQGILTFVSGSGGSTPSFQYLIYSDLVVPGLGFVDETGSGLYRQGPNDWSLTIDGQTILNTQTVTVAGVTGNIVGIGGPWATATDPDSVFQACAYYQNQSQWTFNNLCTSFPTVGSVLVVANGPDPLFTTVENYAFNTSEGPGYLSGGGALFTSPGMKQLTIGCENDYYTFTLSGAASITAGTTYTNNGVTFTVLHTTSSSTSLECSGASPPTTSGTLTFVAGSPSGDLTFTDVATDGRIGFTVGGRLFANEVFRMTSSAISTSNQLPLLTGDGTTSAPGFAFAAEPFTGWMRTGTYNPTLIANAKVAFDVKFVSGSPQQINFGMGTTASSSGNAPLLATTLSSGVPIWQFANSGQSASSGNTIECASGPLGRIGLSNYSYGTFSYYGGSGVLYADNELLGLILSSQYGTGFIGFGVGGGLTAANERMRLTTTALTLSGNVGLVLSGASSGTFTWNAASSTMSYAVTLPAAQSAGALTNDGSGNLSWASASTTAPTRTVLTAVGSGTYPTPVGAQFLKVTIVAGGGGGGGTAGGSDAGAGGGGGGGSTIIYYIPTPTTSYSYTVGGGGTGGSAGNNPGSAGGSSVFNGNTATGGSGGGGSGTANVPFVGGAPGSGGSASGGDIDINGQAGQTGLIMGSSASVGGAGGTSTMSGGAKQAEGFGAGSVTGNSAAGYGGGGGGGSATSGSGAAAGGDGSQGIILIEEYY